MRWTDLPLNPSRTTLRQFAGLCLLFFGGLAVSEWFREHTTRAMMLGALAVLVGAGGLLRPEWVRPVFVGWMVVTFPIGWTVSQLVLAILYYGIMTPLGLIFRLAGRDSLDLRGVSRESYWVEKPQPGNVRRYFRQY